MWAVHDDRLFATTLTIFFLFNIAGFAYILWFVRPIILTSRNKYLREQTYFSLAQLELVCGYMNGAWQWRRFGVGTLLIALMNAICFSTTIRIAVGDGLSHVLQVPADLLTERLPTFTFVTFVVLMEGWIWVQRARINVALDLLEQLNTKFTLIPIQPATQK